MRKRKLIQIDGDNIGDMDRNIAFYNLEEQDLNKYWSDGSTQNIVLKTGLGYAKDSKQVYYYNYWGKAKIIKKANPKTFVSFNNGHYAKDDQFVFDGNLIIKGAYPKIWQLLDIKVEISKDAKKVFYRHKALSTIDVHGFQIDTVVVKNEIIKLWKTTRNSASKN